MPIIKVKSQGKVGYRFGKTGKVFYGRGAIKRAKKQGAAISISKKRKR